MNNNNDEYTEFPSDTDVISKKDLDDWDIMLCRECHKTFSLLDSIVEKGCKCPYCKTYHGDLI